MAISTSQLARIAGLLYLVLVVCGGFSQLVVRGGAFAAGDPSATAARIRETADLFRLGFVTEILNIICFVGVAMALYVVLAPTSRRASAAFVVFNVVAATIIGVSLIAHAGALILATDSTFAQALGNPQADALALLFLELHGRGYLVAEVFFGLWLVPLGYAVYRSPAMPRLIGLALIVGGVGYLASFVATVASGFVESGLSPYLALPAGIAEVIFLAWLILRGAKGKLRPVDATTLASSAAAG